MVQGLESVLILGLIQKSVNILYNQPPRHNLAIFSGSADTS